MSSETAIPEFDNDGEAFILKQAAEKLRLDEGRFGDMFDAAAIGIAVSTPHGRYLQANAAYCRMLGYTEDELRTQNFASLTHPDDLSANLELRDELLAGRRDSLVIEKRYLKKHGGYQWTRISCSAARGAGGEITALVVIAEDIAERKLAELRLHRLNRLHTVQSKVGEAILRTRGRQELYDNVCRIIVEDGLLRMVFIAAVDVPAGVARPVACYGAGLEYLSAPNGEIPIMDGGPLSQGTAGTALRTGAPDFCNDIGATARMKPWREAALSSGLLANASFPLKMNAQTVGVLVLYAGEREYFQDDETALMLAVADQISFALEVLEQDQQRRRAEIMSQLNEARYRTMLEGVEAGVVVHGADRHITALNGKAMKLLAVTGEQLVGRAGFGAAWGFFRRDGSPMSEAELPYCRAALGKQPVADTVVGVQRPASGDLVWLLVTANPVLTEHGDIAEVIVTFMDVTAQIRAERALEESEGRHRALVEWSPESIAVQAEQNLVYVNPAAIRMMGAKSADDLVGKSLLDLVHPDCRQIVSERVRHGTARDGTLSMIEQTLLKLDGTPIVVEIQGTQIMYDGRPALYASMRDITEQKRIEARFRRLLDSNAESLFFWNTGGEINGANDSFLRLVGYTREDLEAGCMRWAAMTPAEYTDVDRRAMKEIADTGICKTYEKEFIRKDGRRTPILIGAAIFEDNRDEGVCFVVDLTERKLLEQQLRQSQKLQSLGQLTGGIAHDFNNLLGIVQLNLELLRERLADDPESLEMAGVALQATERGAGLTHQLLAYARQQPLEPKTVNIETLLSGMANLLSRTLGEGITIETIVPADLWTTRIDPHQLENALLNLGVNALHAMPDGGKLIIEASNKVLDEIYIALNPDVAPGEYVKVAVTDTGVGMSKEVLDRAMEPFFTTKPAGKGSGLGLSMVQGFAKQSGGHMKIYSEPGFGATITLFLPRATIAEEQTSAERRKMPASTGGETVLVVEDNAVLRALTIKVLTGLGYLTLEAKDGPAACLMMDQAGRLDLLLTDVVLPKGIYGPEIALRARARWPGVKVLYMSGYPRDAVLHNGELDHRAPLLSKPFAKAELAVMVRKVLDGGDGR